MNYSLLSIKTKTLYFQNEKQYLIWFQNRTLFFLFIPDYKGVIVPISLQKDHFNGTFFKSSPN